MGGWDKVGILRKYGGPGMTAYLSSLLLNRELFAQFGSWGTVTGRGWELGIGSEGTKRWGRSMADSLTGLLVTGMASGRAGSFQQS